MTAPAPLRQEVSPPPRSLLRRALKPTLVGLAVCALTLVSLYFGLVDHTAAAGARAERPLPAEIDARLRSDPATPLELELGAPIEVDGHSVLPGSVAVRRPGRPEAHRATFHFYVADAYEGRAPAVILTPILGGDNPVAKLLADDLASHGMHAVIVDRSPLLFEDTTLDEGVEQAFRDMIADRRRVLDWLQTRPEVDPDAIGAFGVSLGGITTTVLAEVEPRIKAAAVVMAGGSLASLIPRSAEGPAQRTSRAHGVSLEATADELAAFESLAAPILRTCPLVLAPHADPARFLLITTRRDQSVPSFLQERLHQALGQPERYSLPTGHYTAVWYLPLIKRVCRRFLRERLAPAQ